MEIKRIIASVLVLWLLIPFCGCTGNEEPINTDELTTLTPAETQPVTTEDETTAEATTAAATTAADTTTAETEVINMKKVREYKTLNYDNVKAMWLSQFDLNNVYCQSGSQRDKESFRKLIKEMLSYDKGIGINTVIVQVRPNADSMYPSEVYPASSYVVGSYGSSHTYDPFQIIIEEAHAIGLSVHAWINPMRCMQTKYITSINKKFAIRKWYNDKKLNGNYIVDKSGTLYLNPGYEEVRNLIIKGAAEILVNYDVDGLHMDDYFYPTTDASFDTAAFSDYRKNGGSLSLDNWRRQNLNLLVSGLYSTCKTVGEDIIFGISPAGNINTVYNSQYADVYTWCSKPGYIDYICPQVYFGLEHQNYDFKKVCNTFRDIIKTDSVKLIIGMTLGKAKSKVDQYAGSGKNEWAEHTDILKRCLEYTDGLDKCTGVSYFCYQYFRNPVTGAEETATKAERDNFIPLLKDIKWVK